jgi:hypothetical protein
MSACPPNASEGSFSFSLGRFFHPTGYFRKNVVGY